MEDEQFSCADVAEAMRKRHRYRQMIMSGKLVLPFKSAARLLGPDCLYHLYSHCGSENPGSGQKPPASGRRKSLKRPATSRQKR
jgi:hypothetical protein